LAVLFVGHEGRSESKERFVIQRYSLITGKKENMQVLSHIFTFFFFFFSVGPGG
jgi:hypothetical protein